MLYNKYTAQNLNAGADLSGRGRLIVGAYHGSEANPAAGAVINVMSGGNIVERLIADSSGQSEEIILPTPSAEFSMNENMPKPYGEYDIIVESGQFGTTRVNGAQILPNATAVQEVTLRGENSEITVDEPALWGEYPPKIAENDQKPLPPSTGFIVLDRAVVPEFVIVHAGTPTNASAQNYWVPFKDYIKNVASSEIYANWPEQTLRANILAIISLTLNRVYTEWYRNQGYDFTITNSTAYDQAFTYGRNIFQEISVVVDDIFTSFITKPSINQPLFTQYCDGQKSSCPTWMSQWGSKSLGDQGYGDIDILRHYYGSDIYIMQAEKVSGIPSSFPGTTLQTGSNGPNVRVIQTQLNAVANNFPAIKKVRVSGDYDNDTMLAVKEFQKIFNLPQSGIVDFATWYRISEKFVAVTKIAEGS
jgi:hypothetical protein